MADFLLKSKNKIKSLSLPKLDTTKIPPIPKVNTTNIYRGLFDNMIWVIVLVGALLILIMAYLSRQSLSTNTAVNNLKKEFGTKIQLHGIDEKSASGTEQEFDEIDIDKHRLTDLQISSSAKSYLTGRQILDYASGDIVVQVLKMGARFIELDLRLNKQGDIVIANGITNGNWKLTLNTINLDTFCLKLSKLLFDPNVFSNFRDPVLLYLNITFRKEKIEELYDIIFRNFEKVILNHQYSLRGKKDVLQATIKELLGKLIIITSGTIGDTKMMDIVHLRIGDKVRRIYFEDLVLKDRDEMIQFNKYHLTIVVPKVGYRAINYNPDKALDYGCQIVAMHFQRIDDFLREYLSHFSEKSFRVKPFEFTRFHDTIQKGYDQSKIAYYDTYNKEDNSFGLNRQEKTTNQYILGKFNELVDKSIIPTEENKITNNKKMGTLGMFFTIHKNFKMSFVFDSLGNVTELSSEITKEEENLQKKISDLNRIYATEKNELIKKIKKVIKKKVESILTVNKITINVPITAKITVAITAIGDAVETAAEIDDITATGIADIIDGITTTGIAAITAAITAAGTADITATQDTADITADITAAIPAAITDAIPAAITADINTAITDAITDAITPAITIVKIPNTITTPDTTLDTTLTTALDNELTTALDNELTTLSPELERALYDVRSSLRSYQRINKNIIKVYSKSGPKPNILTKDKPLYTENYPKYEPGSLLLSIGYNTTHIIIESVLGKSADDLYGEGNHIDLIPIASTGTINTIEFNVTNNNIEIKHLEAAAGAAALSKISSFLNSRKEYNDVIIEYNKPAAPATVTSITYENLNKSIECCQTNIDDSMYDLKQIKSDACKKIETSAVIDDKTKYLKKVNDKYICSNGKPIENVNYNFNAIRIKLKKLNIAEHIDIEEIEKLSDSNTTSLDTYRDKHIFLKETQDLIENKFDLIYFILTKQLKKALSKERKKLFTTDYEDKCVQLDSTKCVEEPICHIKTMVGDTCQKNTDKVPFNQYCLPRYEVPNRNLCFDKEGYKEINNENLRRQYHKKLTDNNFAGRWESQGGIIEIPQSFNAYCEFKFKTEADDKEYTMYIVDNTGTNIKLVDFQDRNINEDGLIAKGTFVDNKLRAIEDRYNLPRLVYHGFAELKMQSAPSAPSDPIYSSLNDCFINGNSDNNIKYFLGVYQYSAEVTTANKKYNKLNKANNSYIINGYEQYNSLPTTTTKDFCYQMVLPDCNLQLQNLFGRNSKVSFGKKVEGNAYNRSSDEEFKKKLAPIESFSNMETESPYDPDYINQFTFTGQLSLEFDPTETETEDENEYPSFSPADTVDVALSENNPLSNNNNIELDVKQLDKDIKLGSGKYFNDQTCHIRDGKAYYKLFDKEKSDKNTLEEQYHKACDKYFRGIGITDFKNYSILKHVSKLNVKGELKKKVGKMLIELGHELSESDIKKINELKGSNILNFIKKTANVKKDKDNMYQTRASKPEENIVDTITSHEKLPLCLKQYKGDEERCFPNNNKVEKKENCLSNVGPNLSPSFESKKIDNEDYNTCCAIPKCFNPRLVIGSCTINADDVEPFYFEHNAHFQIKPHPENNKRRMIYLNYDEEPRKCESNKEYFTAYLLKLKLLEDIKMLEVKISLLKSNSDHLTEEEKKEYEKLGKELEKLKSQTGEFNKGEESHIDYHQLTKDLNTKIRDKNELYQKFKPKMKEKKLKILEDKINLKNKMLVKLEKKIKTNIANGSYKIINKKKCLKYKAEGEALLVNIMYENDRRNLKQEMRSDWIIEKQFDETGKFTGYYKIRAEINGKKYNLSRKPMPKKQVFSIFRLPVINPVPKPEDQLWIIKEVGDINIDRELGQTQIENEILSTYDEEKKQIKDNTMQKLNDYVS